MFDDVLLQIIADVIGTSASTSDEMLQIRRRLLPPPFIGKLPAVLPLDAADQSPQLATCMRP